MISRLLEEKVAEGRMRWRQDAQTPHQSALRLTASIRKGHNALQGKPRTRKKTESRTGGI